MKSNQNPLGRDIYALEGYSEFAPTLTALFVALDDGRIKAATSELTLAESLVKPMMDGNKDIEAVYLETLQPSESLDVIPISRQILIAAARLRAETKSLTLPDAIHLATARLSGCQSFLTNDHRLKSIPGIEVIVLTDAA
jgi:predicted nucleic acid-binding protein